ncbi:MAG: helix-turn-helix domain-containing protein [bacterium]
MFSFQKKEITPMQTAGQKLKNKRLEKGLELEAVSDELQITEIYLAAIENGNFDELPGEVYIKKFLQSYCDFLDLDFEEIFKEYEQENNVRQMIKKVNIEAFSKETKKTAKHWYSFITFNLFKNLILVSLVIASLAFLSLKVNNIIAPPKLLIFQPSENIIIKDNYIEIIGKTDIGAVININGQNLLLNPDGGFKDKLDLQSGLNIIKISAQKKYSKEAVVYREIIVEQ